GRSPASARDHGRTSCYWRPAAACDALSFPTRRSSDLEALLALQEVDYREDGYPFEREAARRAFDALIAHAEWGRLWVVRDARARSEEHTSELQSRENLVCPLLLAKKNDPPKFTFADRR